jgi:redox-sensing transcriptional repressor
MPKIPLPVAARLPLYYEYALDMEKAGTASISSNMIAGHLGFTPSTIRQDMMSLGKLDSSSSGYSISSLKAALEDMLGISRGANMALVGIGSLGLALAHSRQFMEKNFIIRALFDKRPGIIGSVIDGIPVYPMDVMSEVILNERITIGIIATPPVSAQNVADELIASNIKGIWNFTSVALKIPAYVRVENVNVLPSLFKLSLLIKTDEKD